MVKRANSCRLLLFVLTSFLSCCSTSESLLFERYYRIDNVYNEWNGAIIAKPRSNGIQKGRPRRILFASTKPSDNTKGWEGDSSSLSKKTANESTIKGLLNLLTVPIVWGTYVPTVRFMYEIDPPVPGLVFSASYLCVAALSSFAWLSITRDNTDDASISNGCESETDSIAAAATGGVELGLYTFLANSLQVVGLETVASDRAGFLIQLTTIMVPIVQAILDGDFWSVPRTTWFACIVALMGVAVMGFDTNVVLQSKSLESFDLGFTQGDAFIVGAALLYTMHVVRLGFWAQQSTPLKLASAKSVVQSILSLGLVAFLCSTTLIEPDLNTAGTSLFDSAVTTGREITQFFSAFRTNLASGELSLLSLGKISGAILWSGVIGTAYVLYAQSYGQRFVRPSDANLVYSLQPIFTALFAYFLLGETMEPSGFVGGALILGAVYLVASSTLGTHGNRDNSTAVLE